MKRILIQLSFISIIFGCHEELPPQPVAKFTFTNGGCIAPCDVTFTSGSEHANTLEWDFNDGTPIEKGVTITHKFAKGKNYSVKLIAKSKDGGSSGAQQMVEVKPEPATPPEADFKHIMSNDSIAPSKVTFDNQSGNATRYEWDFGDPNATTDNPNKSTDENPSHTYSKPGKYKVTLTAYNADGKVSTKTIEIEIKSVKAVADFTFTGGDCQAPCEVTFTNKSTSAKTYSWDFGDDSPKSNEPSPKHTYAKDGTYTVTLTVTGDGGQTSVKEEKVVIKKGNVNAVSIKSEFNQPSDIIADASGNIYVCGQTQGETIFGDGKSYSSGPNRKNDFFIAKYNSAGQVIWAHVDGSAENDNGRAMALDDRGNVYLTGYVGGAMRINNITPREIPMVSLLSLMQQVSVNGLPFSGALTAMMVQLWRFSIRPKARECI